MEGCEGVCGNSLLDLSLAGRRECRTGRAKRQRLFAKSSKKILGETALLGTAGQGLPVATQNPAAKTVGRGRFLIALAVYCRGKPISCTLSVAWCGDVNVGGGCESNFGFVAGHVVGLDPFCRDHRLAGNVGWHLFLLAVALSAGAISVFRFQSLRFRRPGEA